MEYTAQLTQPTNGSSAIHLWRRLQSAKYMLALVGCLMMGIALGCASRIMYGGASDWSSATQAFCAGFRPALLYISPMTVGFVAAIFLCAPFVLSRRLIYPAVCFRGMGLGSLLCGLIQAEGAKGLCFVGLVFFPYAVINSIIAVNFGEFALGMRESFGQGHTGLTGGLLCHTIVRFMLYLSAAALSCALFAASCEGFGRYLL